MLNTLFQQKEKVSNLRCGFNFSRSTALVIIKLGRELNSSFSRFVIKSSHSQLFQNLAPAIINDYAMFDNPYNLTKNAV